MRVAGCGGLGLGIVLWSACGWGRREDGPAVAPEPVEVPEVEPPAEPEAVAGPEVVPGAVGRPRLVVLEPAAGRCVWRMFDPERHARVLAESSGDCPDEILWDPSGREVVIGRGSALTIAPWLRKGEAVAVSLPELRGEASRPWIAADTGKLRVAVLADAQVTEQGSDRVFAAGVLSAVVGQGGAAYGVRGREVVAPGAGDRDVFLPGWGSDAIAVFFDRTDAGWTQIAALPTRYAADDTPGIDVGGPLLEAAKWPSWSSWLASCERGGCSAPLEWQGRAELRAAVGVGEGDELGFVAGPGGGWLFGVLWGDTPHAFGPVLWCADADCGSRTALEGLPEGQLAVEVRGEHLLVGEEHMGAGPRLYRAGAGAPVLAVPGAAAAAWLPEEGLPGLD